MVEPFPVTRLQESPNGSQERLDLGDEPSPVPAAEVPAPRQLREVKRDRALAHIAVLLMDATKVLEPLIEVISARLLRWVALGSAVALAFAALRTPSWERLAVLAVFMLLCPWLLRRVP